ncbi:MAG: hypothetical protein KGQ59_06925 [Bdellovibrionales bacterium]|nr:hypothetical protein [Bdellovibrionales bacterium]
MKTKRIGHLIMASIVLSNLSACQLNLGVEYKRREASRQPAPPVSGENPASAAEGRVVLLTLAKAKINDSQEMRKRAEEAANLVETSAVAFFSKRAPIEVHSLREVPMESITLSNSQSAANITREGLVRTLSELRSTLTTQDTVVIYTHSHGAKTGLILNNYLTSAGSVQADIMPWDELGDLLLALPAKNVIVFTMSCYGGGLISYLNKVQSYWSSRAREGRRFLVISAQDAENLSAPNQIVDGNETRLMNGLPFAIYKAFTEADGYSDGARDGAISFEELSQYVYAVSRSAGSNQRYTNNSQKVQSYEPGDSITP